MQTPNRPTIRRSPSSSVGSFLSLFLLFCVGLTVIPELQAERQISYLHQFQHLEPSAASAVIATDGMLYGKTGTTGFSFFAIDSARLLSSSLGPADNPIQFFGDATIERYSSEFVAGPGGVVYSRGGSQSLPAEGG